MSSVSGHKSKYTTHSPLDQSFKKSKIAKLLSPQRKRKRPRDSVDDGAGSLSKKPRRSTRVRFQPLKYWEGEAIRSDPNRMLTMKDVKEQGDALLISSQNSTKCTNSKSSKKSKKEKKIVPVIHTELSNLSSGHSDDDSLMDIAIGYKPLNPVYQCQKWEEYKDPYYKEFDGSAWVVDDENPLTTLSQNGNIGKMENDEDSIEEEDLSRTTIVSLPSNLKMKKKRNSIYGAVTMERKVWRSLLLEIPPDTLFEKEIADGDTLFFVHRGEKKCLEYTLFASGGGKEEVKTFRMGEGGQFWVPKNHSYALKNTSKGQAVVLHVTRIKS